MGNTPPHYMDPHLGYFIFLQFGAFQNNIPLELFVAAVVLLLVGYPFFWISVG